VSEVLLQRREGRAKFLHLPSLLDAYGIQVGAPLFATYALKSRITPSFLQQAGRCGEELGLPSARKAAGRRGLLLQLDKKSTG